ncbi:hypothetical protein BLNAU_24009 [Blattamonas nauphoetae]|uniref:Uncharacterized protein n=1 Tax=Blattamonas nauphoetae TaxID=2049346 RepID=A0ABQ9WQN8_9EUKA|nr:hypothetical protein BLNAU_24009 [Blattamonas nauphoetae]
MRCTTTCRFQASSGLHTKLQQVGNTLVESVRDSTAFLPLVLPARDLLVVVSVQLYTRQHHHCGTEREL